MNIIRTIARTFNMGSRTPGLAAPAPADVILAEGDIGSRIVGSVSCEDAR